MQHLKFCKRHGIFHPMAEEKAVYGMLLKNCSGCMETGIWNRVYLPVKIMIMNEIQCSACFFPFGPVAQPALYCTDPVPVLFLYYHCRVSTREIRCMQNILQPHDFFLLSLSSVLIAAAGYIINDYFDLNIDRINKPEKIVVEKIIKRRWAIIWHWILSGMGILIGFYLSWKLRNIFHRPFQFTLCVAALVLQHHFQKKITDWKYSDFFSDRLGDRCALPVLNSDCIVLWIRNFMAHFPGFINSPFCMDLLPLSFPWFAKW